MNDNIEKNRIETGIKDTFYKSLNEINHWSVDRLNDLRQEAIDNFINIGLPGKNDERYKYTDILKIFSHDYSLSLTPQDINLDIDDIFSCDIPDLKTQTVIVMNGRFFIKHNKEAIHPGGLIIDSLINAAEKYPDLINKYFNQQAEKSEDSLVHLNTAFAQDGI